MGTMKETVAEFQAERAVRGEDLARRSKQLEAEGAFVAWIPNDRSSFVEGHGYRVALVKAGDDGYQLTGTWPYTGAPGEKAPWFWGLTYEAACQVAEDYNRQRGISPEVAAVVILRSMGRARAPRAGVGRGR